MDIRAAVSAWVELYGLQADAEVLGNAHNLVYVAAQVCDTDEATAGRILIRSNPGFPWADTLSCRVPLDLEAWKQIITFSTHCEAREEHIRRVQTLSVNAQTQLMTIIQELSHQYVDGGRCDGNPSVAQSVSPSVSRTPLPDPNRGRKRTRTNSADPDSDLQAENARLQQEVDRLTKQLRVKDRRSTIAAGALLDREEVDELRDELENAQSEALRLRKEANRGKTLEKENADLEVLVDTMRGELDDLRSKADKAKKLEAQLEAAHGLKEKLRVEAEKASDLQRRAREAEAAAEKGRAAAAELQQCHEMIRDKTLEQTELRGQIRQLGDELQKATHAVDALTTSKADMERELDTLRRAREEEAAREPAGNYHVEPLEELQELEDLRAENARLREESNRPDPSIKLKVELDSVSTLKDHFETRCGELTAQLTAAEAAKAAELTAAQQACDAKSAELATSEQKLAEALARAKEQSEADAIAQAATAKEHATTVAQLLAESEAAKAEQTAAEADREAMVTQLKADSEAAVAQLKAEHAAAQVGCETMVAQLKADSEAAVAQLKAEHVAAMAQLKSEHDAAVQQLQAQHAATVAQLEATPKGNPVEEGVLRAEAVKHASRAEGLERHVLAASRELKLAIVERQELLKELEQQRASAQHLSSELEAKTTDCRSAQEKSVAAREELAHARARAELLERQLEEAGPSGAAAGGLVALTEARKQALDACEQTTRERDLSRQQYASLMNKSKATESNYLRLKEEYEVLTKELEQQVHAQPKASAGGAFGADEVSQLRMELKTARLEAVQRNAEAHDLRTQMLDMERSARQDAATENAAAPAAGTLCTAPSVLKTAAPPALKDSATLKPRGILKTRNM